MRWFKSSLRLKSKVGSIRTITKFLFIPKCLPNLEGEDQWRWLETANIEQRVIDRFDGMDTYYVWVDMKWV